MIIRSIGWLLGLERVASVDRMRLALGAEWATSGSGPFWLSLSVVGIAVLVAIFYLRFQNQGSHRKRVILATVRALLLVLLVFTLAEPVLRITVSRLELPQLFVVFDGTASMSMRDAYNPKELAELVQATGVHHDPTYTSQAPTRQEYVAAWLTHSTTAGLPKSLLAKIHAAGACRMRFFIFDGKTDSRVRELIVKESPDGHVDWKTIASQLSNTGEVTAIGTVLRDLNRQSNRRQLAGVVLISDFGQNSGEYPADSADQLVESPVQELGVPVYPIGVGAPRTRDLEVLIESETRIRLGEKTAVDVRLKQTGIRRGETVQVRVFARDRSGGSGSAPVTEIGVDRVTLNGANKPLQFLFAPQRAGELVLRAHASIVPGEVVTENNRAAQRVQVIDDFIRLLYVAYEPTWEWRFVKEVFHRDPAVGLRGFRTYLASSDPRVRQSNPLFLPTLTQTPKDFFATDVVFLDDVPRPTLTPDFCSKLEQFVRDLGGGLVVIAGPRFGVRQLIDTPLAKMLPVIIDPRAKLQDQSEFSLELSARAGELPFMRLDDDPQLNLKAWDNLSRLPWYQPVANKHERAIVLAQHPTDKCLDGKTPQPLIAIRRYGAGEVVYLGFNETWRLRRKYGDKYYRRFWLPMIDRLGLSHALGPRKRFVVRTDRRKYRIEDEVIVRVQAYDDNYQPLDPATIDGSSLSAELLRINESGETEQIDSLRIDPLRPGLFEARYPVLAEGTYRVRVEDPVTQSHARRQFEVTGVSAEMRSTVRNETLSGQLVDQSRGVGAALHQSHLLKNLIKLTPYHVTEEHNYLLWQTPLWFIVIISLMLGEWLLRKWIHLV